MKHATMAEDLRCRSSWVTTLNMVPPGAIESRHSKWMWEKKIVNPHPILPVDEEEWEFLFGSHGN